MINQTPSSFPLVSVILPVYNGEKYLAEAIESILSQTYANIELIVIDDGSKDASSSMLDHYLLFNEKRMKIIRQENTGLIGALNRGLQECTGVFVARMDQDDISYPERIQTQVDFLLNNPDIDLCGSWIRVFNEEGMSRLHKYPQSDLTIKAKMLFENPIAHPSVMFRKGFLDKYSPYKDIEDYATWLFLAPNSHYANLPIPLLHYREHSENTCKRNNNQRESYARLIHDFVEYHHIPMQIPEEHINVYFCQDRSFNQQQLNTLELFYRDILNHVHLNHSELYHPLKMEILKKLCKLYIKNITSLESNNILNFLKIVLK